MHNIAIIPARGGSKRIPRKNIRNFLGKPIIAYSIEVALQSGLFDEVMVSTDDKEIAEVAIKYGANVPFYRSAENSNDLATTMAVISEVVSEYKNRFNKIFDLVCCIYPTAPLMQSKHLINGFDLLNSKKFDSVFPIVDFGYPIWRGIEITEEGKSSMVWPEFQNMRSQDLKKVYHDAGQWYWLNMKVLTDTIFTQNTGSVVVTQEEAQDIDTEDDWKITQIKYEYIQSIR